MDTEKANICQWSGEMVNQGDTFKGVLQSFVYLFIFVEELTLLPH